VRVFFAERDKARKTEQFRKSRVCRAPPVNRIGVPRLNPHGASYRQFAVGRLIFGSIPHFGVRT
jgi:hypothetical protein